MKIDNTSMSPLSSRPLDSSKRADKKDALKDVQLASTRSDKVEMSEDARLLARARAALDNIDDTNAEKIDALREKIESGDYSIQFTELARKLAVKAYLK